MTLANLIRKRDARNIATAIPAISATQPKGKAATVARIATVAVANAGKGQAVSMTAVEEVAIRAWLSRIGEADPTTITEVLQRCENDADAREYFIRRATDKNEDPWQ